VFLAPCMIATFALSSFSVGRNMRYLQAGTWGGPHIRIEVTGNAATIEYDCAHGTIKGPLRVDSRGRFALNGTYVREHGGPVRPQDLQAGQPARYSGWTDGKKMTLTVWSDTKETVGTFTLVRGEAGHVWKCR
jgi:hypothetical protein